METNQQKQDGIKTRELVLQILRDEFTAPTKINPDGGIATTIYGNGFIFTASGIYLTIWHPRWAGIKRDPLVMPKIEELVDEMNSSFPPALLLQDLDDDDTIAFWSRLAIVLPPSLPDKKGYIESALYELLNFRDIVVGKLDTLFGENAD